MVLREGEPFEPLQAPDIRPSTPVFFLPLTGEVFLSYGEFANRYFECQLPIWGCAQTGKRDLTYEEAAESEKTVQDKIKDFPERYIEPVMRAVHLYVGSAPRAANFAYNTSYFVGEKVDVLTKTRKRRGVARVLKLYPKGTPAPVAEAETLEALKNAQPNGKAGNGAPVDFAALAGRRPSSAGGAPKRAASIQPPPPVALVDETEAVLVQVQFLAADGKELDKIETLASSFLKHKSRFMTKGDVQLLILGRATRPNPRGPWVVKPKYQKRYKLKAYTAPKYEKPKKPQTPAERQANAEADKRRREREKESRLKSKEKEKRKALALKEFMRPREDRSLKDSKTPPPCKALESLLPTECLGDCIKVLEFLFIFADFLQCSYAKVKRSQFEADLMSSECPSLVSDVLVAVMSVLADDQGEDMSFYGRQQLSSLAVDVSTASEVLRVYLAAKAQDFDADDLIEALNAKSFYSLSATEKLQILSFLCDQLTETFVLQEHMEEAATMAKQVAGDWREQISKNKEEKKSLKDTLRDDLERETAEARQKKKVIQEELDSLKKPKLTKEERSRRSKLKQEEEYVKAVLRELRGKAREEADQQGAEQENHFRRQERKHRVLLYEQLAALRQIPLGVDRHFRRYWILKCNKGILVEPVPGHPVLLAPPGDSDSQAGDKASSPAAASSGSSDSSSSDEGEEDEPNAAVDAIKEFESVPAEDPLVWGVYETYDQIDALVSTLNLRGLREKALREAIVRDRQRAMSTVGRPKPFKARRKETPGEAETYLLDECREQMAIVLEELTKGCLLDWDQEAIASFVDRIAAGDLDAICELLLQLEQGLPRKYLKAPQPTPARASDGDDEKEVLVDRLCLGELVQPAEAGMAVGSAAAAAAAAVPNEAVESNVQVWREFVTECKTSSQLYLAMYTLNDSIIWSKSVLKAKCKICKKAGDASELLLCDKCDDGYHMSCLRPKLKKIPEGEWFCPKCQESEKRRTRKGKRKAMDSDGEEDEVEAEVEQPAASPSEAKANGTPAAAKPKGRRSSGRTGKRPCYTEVDDNGMELDSSDGGAGTRRTRPSRSRTSAQLELCERIVSDLKKRDESAAFLAPVSLEEAPDYHEVIDRPMDLETIVYKVQGRQYSRIEDFVSDIRLVCSNALLYNGKSSPISKDAKTLLSYFQDQYDVPISRVIRQRDGSHHVQKRPRHRR